MGLAVELTRQLHPLVCVLACAGVERLEPSSTLFPVHKQEAGLEVKQLELESAPIGDVSAASLVEPSRL